MNNKAILIFQNIEMSVFTTNIEYRANTVNIHIYIYIYDNKNFVPFRRLRY